MTCQCRHLRRDLSEDDRSGCHPNHQNANYESEITDARGDECFIGRIRSGIPIKPVANQDVRSKADQFPKHEKHDEIVRENDPEHGEHEERQRCEITGLAFVISHVTQRIDMNGSSDSGNENDHCPAQRIQGQAKRNLEYAANTDPCELGRAAS